jgi:hypothetical protein
MLAQAHEFVMIGCFVAEFIIFIEIQNFVLVTLKTINVWSPYNLSYPPMFVK